MDHVDRILAQWHQERPDLDVAPMGLIGRIKRLNMTVTKEMEKTWAEHGLNGPYFDMLSTLRRAGPPFSLSPSDLIASTLVTSGTMTNRIDQLQRSGYVERVKNPDDGRGFLISLTQKGFKVIDAAVTAHVATQERLASRLSAKERAALEKALKSYQSKLDNPEP